MASRQHYLPYVVRSIVWKILGKCLSMLLSDVFRNPRLVFAMGRGYHNNNVENEHGLYPKKWYSTYKPITERSKSHYFPLLDLGCLPEGDLSSFFFNIYALF